MSEFTWIACTMSDVESAATRVVIAVSRAAMIGVFMAVEVAWKVNPARFVLWGLLCRCDYILKADRVSELTVATLLNI